MYNPRMRRFFVVCIVVVTMGCAMSATRLYDGAELPQSQVVVLLDSSEAGVYAVDGTRTFGSAVQIEVAIVDRAGNAVAAPAACDGERPTFD